MIGIGIDTVEVERFRLAIERTPHLVERVFTEAERAAASRRPDPTLRLAARFAAKEAAWKAMGVGLGSVDFHDVEVGNLASGQPTLITRGRAAEIEHKLGIKRWLLSMTHTALVAEAVAVALGDES